MRSKMIIEKAMTNKVDYDQSKVRLFNAMVDIEDLIANDLGQAQFTMRAE